MMLESPVEISMRYKHTASRSVTIQQDFAWLRIPIEPGRCGCGHFRCVKETCHERGRCPNAATSTLPTFGLRYLCATCQEYHYGVKAREAMAVR
jgi:hypothetical protein